MKIPLALSRGPKRSRDRQGAVDLRKLTALSIRGSVLAVALRTSATESAFEFSMEPIEATGNARIQPLPDGRGSERETEPRP